MIDRRTLIATSLASPLAFRRNARAQEPLRALGWNGYVDQGTVDRFKTATGIDVVVDTVGSYDEIFLRMRSGGLYRYSVIAPHHGLIGTLRQEGLIQPIDLGLISRFGEIDSRFELPATTVIGSDRFAVPLLFGLSPCIYNADLLPEPPAAWADLDSDAFTGKVGMLDDGLSHFFVAGRATGSTTAPRLSRTEMDQATSLLTNLKGERVSHFTPYPSDLVAMLKSGKCMISTTGWEGMTLLPEASGANLQIARLAPGDFSFVQTLAITSVAPMVAAAHQFIDFMLSAEEQAALANRTVRGIVNQGAVELIDDRIRTLTDYSNLDAVFAQSPILDFPPVTETVDGAATYLDWVVSWEAIRLTTSNAAP